MKNTTRTLLHIITLLAMLGAIFGAHVLPVSAQDAVVKLSPSAANVNVGETVVVNVTIENVSNLFGAEFHINFDTAYLEVVDADSGTEGIQIGLGDFLSPDFIATNTANNTTGVIDFGIAQMAPHGAVSGSGTLATITFRGKAAGTANVVFTSVLLSDPGGSEIPSSAQNGTVTVAGSAATDTPTPTTTATPTATATGPTPTPTATSTGPTATATATTPAATKTTSPPPSSCTIQGYHTVRAGETLYSIGRAYATRPSAIASCNGIVNPSKLYVGTKLAIPVAPWSPIPPGPVAHRQFTPGGAPPPPPPAPGCRYYHTIRYGETLTLIAARYGVSIWTIARANNIYNLNLIYAGDVLCIP